jgi:hypothetical protein
MPRATPGAENRCAEGRYRVWIAAYRQGQPCGWRDVPPDAVALEPAEAETMSAAEAAVYVEAFNRAAWGQPRKIWAIALPVSVCYEGDPRPGQTIAAPLSTR